MSEPKALLDTALAGVKKGKVYDIELLLHQSASGAGYTWGFLFLVVETAECASPRRFLLFSPPTCRDSGQRAGRAPRAEGRPPAGPAWRGLCHFSRSPGVFPSCGQRPHLHAAW